MTIDFTKFGLPADVDLQELQNRIARSNGNGVSLYSGHDSFGLAYRFFIFDEYNQAKSKAAGIELFDQVEMMEVFVDKKTRLHIKVDDRIRYKYPEEYARFKQNREAPGTPLDKWGVMPSNEVATLVKDGIFTVEQFALQPVDKVQGRYPASFYEHFERAQQFVAAKTGKVEADKMAQKMIDLQRAYSELESKLQSLIVSAEEAPEPKKRGRKPKAEKKIITDEDFEQ